MNDRLIAGLQAVLLARGGTALTTRPYWNDHVLALLDQILVASGGTTLLPTLVGHWNDKVIALLTAIAAVGGGGGALTALQPEATWTTFDSSGGSILAGVSALDPSTPANVLIDLQNPGVVSQGPVAGAGIYGPLTDLLGTAANDIRITANSLLKAMLIALRRPGAWATDMEPFFYIYDDNSGATSPGCTAAPTTAMRGFGGGFILTGGEWMPVAYHCAGTGTLVRDPATLNRTSPDADGVLIEILSARLATRVSHGVTAVMASGVRPNDDSGYQEVGAANVNDITGRFNTVALGAGWSAGVGGTAGPIPLNGSLAGLDLVGS